MKRQDEYDEPSNLGIAEPDDLFDPRHYEAVRDEGRRLRGLPLWCYTSERFWQAEKERIFLPRWNLLERAEIVPNVGDFHCMEFLGAPLLLVRGKDAKVRVFANTCRHRGALVADGYAAEVVRERLAGEDDDEDHPWAVLSEAPPFVLELVVERFDDAWLDVEEPPPVRPPAPLDLPRAPRRPGP